jgi:hypothetical protein
MRKIVFLRKSSFYSGPRRLQGGGWEIVRGRGVIRGRGGGSSRWCAQEKGKKKKEGTASS